MKKLILLTLLFFLIIPIYAKGKTMNENKKCILIVSFGTTHLDTMKKTIEACENKIRKQFKDYETRRAFTSNTIRKRLKEKYDLIVDSVDEALQKMKDDDFKEVYIQPLLIIPGEEFDNKIIDSVDKHKTSFDKIKLGAPLLSSDIDYDKAIKSLKKGFKNLKKNQALILMGHGTHHNANSCYSNLQKKLSSTYPNVFVGTVESSPTLDDIIPQLKKLNITEVIVTPFMLVAGDHAKNDMAGDEEDSWKSILKNNGFKVKVVLKGLGEYKDIQDIYIKHLEDIIK